jgi:hypothetical protein
VVYVELRRTSTESSGFEPGTGDAEGETAGASVTVGGGTSVSVLEGTGVVVKLGIIVSMVVGMDVSVLAGSGTGVSVIINGGVPLELIFMGMLHPSSAITRASATGINILFMLFSSV